MSEPSMDEGEGLAAVDQDGAGPRRQLLEGHDPGNGLDVDARTTPRDRGGPPRGNTE